MKSAQYPAVSHDLWGIAIVRVLGPFGLPAGVLLAGVLLAACGEGSSDQGSRQGSTRDTGRSTPSDVAPVEAKTDVQTGTESSDDTATIARFDPTLWTGWGVAQSWAEAPRGIDQISSAVRVSTEGRPGREGVTRCLFGPDELRVEAGHLPVSVIARAGDLRFVQIALNGDRGHFANFDLQSGAATRTGERTPEALVTPLGDGWYRLEATFAVGGSEQIKNLRRFLVVDRGDVGYHPGDTMATGHLFVASPTAGAVGVR